MFYRQIVLFWHIAIKLRVLTYHGVGLFLFLLESKHSLRGFVCHGRLTK
jgi:hypothetical protein